MMSIGHPTARDQLVSALAQQIGRQHSARVVMFHQAVAERLGLNATDLKCLDLAKGASAALTAGRLAELTGLTTGAITGVVDRLEEAGFVRRQRDPHDRRKVIVEPLIGREGEVAKLFSSLADGVAALCARYSDDELALLVNFLGEADQLLHDETGKLRT
jgi:DNA-binding MarR family transcriptional regulator